jgi:hypothetical protein
MTPRSRQEGENIRVLTETEAPRGWSFRALLPADASAAPASESAAPATEIDITLSWVDYEYWSHGAKSPSYIAEVVLRAILDAQPDRALPAKFDASTARRWVKDLDERVRELL